ncbi:MAG: hypothetical protein ACJ763_13640, partial [Bdellovibrionia bacterium]
MNLIKDARTIAGLFREALFHSRSVQIISADYGDITALITDLQEDSSRDISTERQLFLTSSITINNLSDSFSAKIRCAFPQFVLFWNGTITKSETGELVVTLPAEVHLENSRTQARVELIKSTSPSGPILVNTDTFCTEGIFQIEDISEGGFGGSLRVFPEMPIRIGTQLQGRIKTPTGIIEVNGQVVQVSLHSAANTSQADAIYRVGVKNQTFNQSTVHSPPTQSERRKFKRVPVQLDINLLSPYHPEHVVSGLILDASLAGFLARLKDISDAILLPVGCIVQIPQTSILAQVISLEDENVRFQIVQSNSKDRVEWFKRLTPYLNKNTSHSTATGMDIIELFCESGALASTYLKNQRRFAEDFLEAFTARDSQGSWIYRWIERDEEGKIRGHNSIVRLSDHTWSWGSVAG